MNADIIGNKIMHNTNLRILYSSLLWIKRLLLCIVDNILLQYFLEVLRPETVHTHSTRYGAWHTCTSSENNLIQCSCIAVLWSLLLLLRVNVLVD